MLKRFLTISLCLIAVTLGSSAQTKKAASKKAAKATGQVADVATEDINALTVIKVFTREEKEALRFGEYASKNRKASLRAGGLQAQFTPIVSFLVILGTATVLGVGGYVATGNAFHLGFITIPPQQVDIGTLVLFLVFLRLLYQPMRDLSKLSALGSNAASGIERIKEVLEQAPEVLDSQTPYYGPGRLRGEITFDNVVFGYTPEVPVLKGINLHIPQQIQKRCLRRGWGAHNLIRGARQERRRDQRATVDLQTHQMGAATGTVPLPCLVRVRPQHLLPDIRVQFTLRRRRTRDLVPQRLRRHPLLLRLLQRADLLILIVGFPLEPRPIRVVRVERVR